MAASERGPAGETGPHRSVAGSRIAVFVVRGPIERVDILGMDKRLRECLASRGADLVVCDVRTLTSPDVDTVDAIARLQLTAHRQGSQIALRNAPARLKELLAFAGLDEVVQLWS